MTTPLPALSLPDFEGRAACAEIDTGDLWFPDKGDSQRPAKRICGGCEIRDECLDWALRFQVPHGIWGGLGPRERQRLGRRVAPRLQPINHGTPGGYKTHYQRGVPVCDPCRDASNAARRARRAGAA